MRQKAGDNTLSQIHHKSRLRKVKTITLNFSEIKIMGIREKLYQGSYPIGLSASMTKLLFGLLRYLYAE